MPMYDYHCKGCDELYERNVKIAEMNNPQECPYCGSTDSEKFIGGAPALGDAYKMGLVRPPSSWVDRLKEIHKNTPGSILKDNNRYI